jgi:AraC-like DNA-binding protein
MNAHHPVSRRSRVAGLLTSAIAEARLLAAIDSSVELLIHRTVDEHVADVRSRAVVLSVVEIGEDTRAAHVSAVRMLRSQFPSVPVLAYCDSLPGLSRLILDVARAGVAGLLIRDLDDTPHLLRDALRQARHAAIAERVYGELIPHVRRDARPFLRYAVEHAGGPVDVRHAAADLGIDPGTLGDRLSRAHVPSPHKFLMWVRLAVAGELLCDPGRSAEQVALELDFPSGTALRNLFDRYVGVTTAQIKSCGPHAVVDQLKLVLSRPVQSGIDRPTSYQETP